jgi:hypothetical protein
VVLLLFLILVGVKLRDGIYGRPKEQKRLQLRKLLQLRGEEALEEALGEIQRDVNDPEKELFSLLRTCQGAALSVPVTGVGDQLPPEVRLYQERVQVFRSPPEPFLAGDLPHAGKLLLEATFYQRQERIERHLREVPYRLVRLGPPPQLSRYGMVILAASDLISSKAGEYQHLAREDLRRLAGTRSLLERRVRELARKLVVYVAAYRHLGGHGLEADDLQRRWLALLPEFAPALEVTDLSSSLSESSLVARWWAVDLSRIGSFRRWSGYLMGQRLREQQAFELAWKAWQQGVKGIFQDARWSRLEAGDALNALVETVSREVEKGLVEVSQAGQRWDALSRQILRHYRQIFTSFEVLTEVERTHLLEARQRMDREALRRQALADFEGEGAATRCGSFLESVTGPFSKELSGVVFLDNRGGSPLELREKTIPGCLVLVATGDVHLSNVGPRDSRSHRFTVLVEGRLSLKGRIRATVISGGTLEMAPETQVVGGLFLDQGVEVTGLKGRVEWNPVSLHKDGLEDLEVLIEASQDLNPGDESPVPAAR